MSVTPEGIIRGIEKAERIAVIADGEDLSAGNVVKISGVEGSTPKVKKTTGPGDTAIGVMYEDVKNGELGLCIIDHAIVEVVAAGAIKVGLWVCGAAGGKVQEFNGTPLSPAAGATVSRGQTTIGIALQGAAADGDKLQIIIFHAVNFDSSTGT